MQKLQIYFDKLKLTGHKRYDGLLNTSEASPFHHDDREIFEHCFSRCTRLDIGLEREGRTNVRPV